MNGTGFGYPTYPQRPSVKPTQVGAALIQMQSAEAPAAAAPATVAQQAPPAHPPRFSQPSHAPNGAPQRDPDPDPAITMAVHEAMQRQASGGASPGQQGDGNPNNAEQLRRLGLSPLEIRLLGMSGGARF